MGRGGAWVLLSVRPTVRGEGGLGGVRLSEVWPRGPVFSGPQEHGSPKCLDGQCLVCLPHHRCTLKKPFPPRTCRGLSPGRP